MPLPPNDAIIGVQIKPLVSHGDERGFFREIIRSSDPLFTDGNFGQWSHSKMEKNVVKAWHYHHIQHDWWYCPIGQIETVLFDNREESPTYKKKLTFTLGDARKYGQETYEACVRIPPGVLHGLKVLSDEAHLFYITNIAYDPDEEGRIPFNSDLVPHKWGEDVIVVSNDRRAHIPSSKRKILR